MSVTSGTKTESGLGETIRVVIHALLIALVIRTFLFQPFNIPSGSMKATLLVGDYLFVSKYSYGYSHYSIPLSPPLFSGRIFGSEPARGHREDPRAGPQVDDPVSREEAGLQQAEAQARRGVLSGPERLAEANAHHLPAAAREDPAALRNDQDRAADAHRLEGALPRLHPAAIAHQGQVWPGPTSEPHGGEGPVEPLLETAAAGHRRKVGAEGEARAPGGAGGGGHLDAEAAGLPEGRDGHLLEIGADDEPGGVVARAARRGPRLRRRCP